MRKILGDFLKKLNCCVLQNVPVVSAREVTAATGHVLYKVY
jgi:hypothetical protein